MALIIEDGTGKADAQSYADVATVDAYHAARGTAAWTGTDAVKESAILRAMTYLDTMAWNGFSANTGQALSWPRSCMEDNDGRSIGSNIIPSQVVHALCELALRELVSAGSTLPDFGRDDMLTKLSVAGAVEMEWAATAPTKTDYPLVRRILGKLIAPSGGVRLIR